MKKTLFILGSTTLLLIACSPPAEEPIDLEAARGSLMAADKAWSETTTDLPAHAAFLSEGARFQPPDAPQANGRAEFEQFAAALSELPGYSLSWQANFADVSSSGDLGYTVGTFTLAMDGPDGNPVSRDGKYTTVWKLENGEWKVVSDTFNFNAPPPTPED